MTLKEKFGLTSAILSIVMGAWLVIASLFIFSSKDVFGYYRSYNDVALALSSLLMIGAIAMIAVGGVFCARKKSLALAITLMALNGVLLLFEITGMGSGAFSIGAYFVTPPILVTIGMLIAFFCIKDSAPATISQDSQGGEVPWREAEPETATKVLAPRANASKASGTTEKIALLKKLRDDGDITEQEYKTRLLNELDKQ